MGTWRMLLLEDFDRAVTIHIPKLEKIHRDILKERYKSTIYLYLYLSIIPQILNEKSYVSL